MADVNVDEGADFKLLMQKAVALFAQRLAEAIHAEIMIRAHTEAVRLTPEEKAQYYSDESMPFWKGTLLRSMRVEPTGSGGWRVMIGAEFASDIEDGNEREAVVDGLLADWLRDHPSIRVGERGLVVGRAHPFIKPALEYVLEHQAGELFQGALEDSVQKSAFEFV